MKNYTNYNLHLCTEIAFGKGREAEVGQLIKKHGGSKVLLIYGGGSIKRSGLYDRVVKALDEAGVGYVDFGGVQPNPLRSHVEKGIELARANGVDFYLGIGGGSVIDTAKAIAFAILYNKESWFDDLYMKHMPAPSFPPVGSIVTLAAAGSETNFSSMIVDDIVLNDKCGAGFNNSARPAFTILNPELTYSVSPAQTAAGATDIFSHSLERYFYINSDCSLGEGFAVAAMRNVLKYGPIAYKDPTNYEARAELMISATFSQNDITSIGRSGKRGGPHYLEGCLSGHFNITHGSGLAVVIPAWLKYAADQSEEECRKVAQFAIEVFDVKPDLKDMKTIAYEGVARLKAWLRELDMPTTLGELGLSEDDIPVLLGHPVFGPDGVHRYFATFTKDELAEFYRSIM